VDRAAALRIAVLTLPCSPTWWRWAEGNGFVAAFVAGLLFRRAAKLVPHDALHLVEGTGVLLGLLVWFPFGQVINQTLHDGTDWAIVSSQSWPWSSPERSRWCSHWLAPTSSGRTACSWAG
jgi:hypothetical protein